VSVSPDGRRAAVTNYGTRERPGSTLSVVDLERATELRRIDLAPHTRPHGVAWFSADRIAVTAEGTRHLLVVDPGAGRVASAIGTGQEVSHMVAVSRDGTRAYVTSIGSGTTTAFDLAAGRKLGDIATGAGSEALALTPDGRELWVAARADGHLAVVDTASLEVQARLPLPGIPIRIAMTPDGKTALVTCAGASELVAFDVAARSERARRKVDVPLAPGAGQRPFAQLAPGSALPVGLLVSGDGRSAYVAATMAMWSCSTTRRRSGRCAPSRSAESRTGWRPRRSYRARPATPAPPATSATERIRPCAATGRRSSRAAAQHHGHPGRKPAGEARDLSRSTIEAAEIKVGPSACPDRRVGACRTWRVRPRRSNPAGRRGVTQTSRANRPLVTTTGSTRWVVKKLSMS